MSTCLLPTKHPWSTISSFYFYNRSSTAHYTSISRWGLIWWCKRQLNYSFDYVCAQTSILRMKPWLIFPPKALAFPYCHKSKNDERQLGLETQLDFLERIFQVPMGYLSSEHTTTSIFPVSTMNSIPAHITGQHCPSISTLKMKSIGRDKKIYNSENTNPHQLPVLVLISRLYELACCSLPT